MDDTRFAHEIMPHLPTLIRTATTFVSSAYAEDAVQEALVRAWRAWPNLNTDAAIRSWLIRIVVNICLNWQHGRFGTHQRMNEPIDLSFAAGGNDPGSTDQVAALDLRQAIDILDESLRQLVMLRYYVGLDSTEIGIALSLPAATVRTRLRRALTLLRHSLNAPVNAKLEDR